MKISKNEAEEIMLNIKTLRVRKKIEIQYIVFQ